MRWYGEECVFIFMNSVNIIKGRTVAWNVEAVPINNVGDLRIQDDIKRVSSSRSGAFFL